MKTTFTKPNRKARRESGGQVFKFGLAVGIAALAALQTLWGDLG